MPLLRAPWVWGDLEGTLASHTGGGGILRKVKFAVGNFAVGNFAEPPGLSGSCPR